MESKDYTELRARAVNIRVNALKAIYAAGSGHPGGSLSCADILAALYFEVMNIDPERPDMEERDRFVLSKGHAAPALYAVLAERGYYDVEEMMSLRKVGSRFQGHPSMGKVPGVEMSTGSLGQGFSVAVGMATANKIDGRGGKVYVLTGDGELQEGIIWEAAMSASQHRLDNLVCLVDLNGLQIDGNVNDVKSVYSVCAKFEACGWKAECCDGHDFEQLVGNLRDFAEADGRPTLICCRTHKGQGVSFMTDQAGWHGKAPNEEEFRQAIAELEQGIQEYAQPKGCHRESDEESNASHACGEMLHSESEKGGER